MEIMVVKLRQPRGLWTLISLGRLSTSGSAGSVLDAKILDAKKMDVRTQRHNGNCIEETVYDVLRIESQIV